jgi:hypothetical protein
MEKFAEVSEQCAASIFRVEEYPEDGSSTVLRNIGTFLPDYTASYPKRQSR